MKTMECTPRETLKRYLAGWVDGEESSQIEQHLATCVACEQTVVELEENPDTLIETLRQPGQVSDPELDEDSKLDQAVSQVKRLMDEDGDSGPMPVRPVPDKIGMYELVEPLGRGGMATVYLARHRTLGKLVAIKIRPARWRECHEAAARFEREIRASGKLNHPSIVNATDAGEQDGIQYLVMEYIAGMDLGRIARQIRSLPIADACEMMRQVALGLSHAHAEGVVHRDIKPSNLMLDEKGSVKILDFGLAQLDLWDEATAELTSVGQLMGTLDYMAPEQAERSGAVDYRADLYSLGATLFRLLCGRAPLAAAPNVSPLDKLRLLAQHQPPRLDTLRSDAPRELTDLVAELLSREPESRPPSAAHVAERLASLTEGADLSGLLATAKTAEEKQPMDHAESRFALNAISLVAVRPQSVAGRGNRIRKWLTLAALAPLCVLAAVIIVLETQKGQLVVESEVPGVSVKVVENGETVETMRIDVGASSTRLAAGKYQVMIESPSDSVAVDKDVFVVKKGETTVARITQKSASGVSIAREGQSDEGGKPGSRASSAESVSGDPRAIKYEGRTLDSWLNQLETDRSGKAIGDALVAIDAMLMPATAPRIRDVVLKVVPTLDGERYVGHPAAGVTVDAKALAILSKSLNRHSFFELIGKQVIEGDAKWARRVLSQSLKIELTYTDKDVEPLLRQLDTALFRNDQLDAEKTGLVELASPWLWNVLLREGTGKEFFGGVVEIVDSSERLKSDFWLRRPPALGWPPAAEQLVVQKAFQTLALADAPPDSITRACMILFAHLHQRDSTPWLDIDAVAKAIQSHLERIATDGNRAFALMNFGNNADFREYSPPVFASPERRDRQEPRRPNPKIAVLSKSGMIGFTSDGTKISETQEILDLALLAKSKFTKQFDARGLVALTQSSYDQISQVIPIELGTITGLNMSLLAVLSWPDFRPIGGLDSTMQQAVDLPPRAWLGCLLHLQAAELSGTPVRKVEPIPAGNPDLAANAAASAPNAATNPDVDLSASTAGAVSSDQSLYEGRPLEIWLQLLARDRSPKTMGDAFQAIEAMQTPENAAQIRETLLGVLPKIDGNTIIRDTAQQERWVDQKAFEIIAKGMPPRDYFEMLTNQLTTAGVEWGTRIFRSGVYSGWNKKSKELSVSDLEPLIQWFNRIISDKNTDERSLAFSDLGATWMLRVLRESPASAELTDPIAKVLDESPNLGPEFWLRQPTTVEWPIKLRRLVNSRAKNTLTSEKPSAHDVTKACMILAAQLDEGKNDEILSNAEIDEITAAAQSHLARLGSDRARTLQTVEVGRQFEQLNAPAFPFRSNVNPVTAMTASGVFHFAVTDSACEVQEVIDLASQLKQKYSKEFDARKLMELTLANYKELRPMIPVVGRMTFDWPGCRSIETQSFGGPGMPRPTASPEQWRGYFFHIQAAYLSGSPVPMDEGIPVDATSKRPSFRTGGGRGADGRPRAQNPQISEKTSAGGVVDSEEAVYDGRTLADWLRQLARDRSPKSIGESLVAIEAMQTTENATLIREALFKTLPRIDGETVVETNNSSVDYKAFEIIAKPLAGKEYFVMLVDQLKQADGAWARRILSKGGFKKVDSTDDELKPLIDWLGENILASESLDEKRKPIVDSAANWLLWVVNRKQASEKISGPIVHMLATSEHLGDFLLRQPLDSKWPAALKKLVLSKAEEALQKVPDPGSIAVTQATMILFAELQSPVSTVELDLAGLASGVQRHLERLGNDPSRALAIVELGHGHFGKLVAPAFLFKSEKLDRNDAERWSDTGVFRMSVETQAAETQELLDLAHLIDSKKSTEFDVKRLLAITSAKYFDLRQHIDDLSLFEVRWPSFTAIQVRGAFRGGGQLEHPAEEWLGYLIHIQAAHLSRNPVPLSEPKEEKPAEKN